MKEIEETVYFEPWSGMIQLKTTVYKQGDKCWWSSVFYDSLNDREFTAKNYRDSLGYQRLYMRKKPKATLKHKKGNY